ncbi:MAG: hypothetical protein LBR79_02810 [Oscillospiraceae bacterium]|nr:hypothetical protein [Oscillospiraceae bacterium]
MGHYPFFGCGSKQLKFFLLPLHRQGGKVLLINLCYNRKLDIQRYYLYKTFHIIRQITTKINKMKFISLSKQAAVN